MLKLLTCAAVMMPCLALPFAGTETLIIEPSDKTQFSAAFAEPAIETLSHCKPANLDIFFHDSYVTAHSAEFVAAGIKTSETCLNPTYTITPIIAQSEGEIEFHARAAELSQLLKDHGISAKLSSPKIETEHNGLPPAGPSATLTISFDNMPGDNA